jgi:hypothetical protein
MNENNLFGKGRSVISKHIGNIFISDGLDCVFSSGSYVGLPEYEDDFNFNESFTTLKAEFEEQLKEEERLNVLIAENLKRVKLV